MNQKRVLLLHSDSLLANLFLDKLVASGFAVEIAHDGEAGLKSVGKRRPDAVVVDPVLPGPEIGSLVTQMRALTRQTARARDRSPKRASDFCRARAKSGRHCGFHRSVNPIADMVDALEGALGMDRTTTLTKGLVFRAEDSWLKMSLNSAPETLTALRRALHGLSREGGSPEAAQDFFQRIHGFSEQMAILGQRPLHYLSAQMEALALDIFRYPEQINPSVLRTLSQAVDFLSTLLPDQVRSRIEGPRFRPGARGGRRGRRAQNHHGRHAAGQP